MTAKIYIDTGKHETRNGTDAFIKIKEAAKLVGRPAISVRYALKHGHIKYIKAPNIKGPYGFLYLVKREDVIKWASYQNKPCDSHEPGKGTVPAKADVKPVAEKQTAEASLESYSDEELVAALTDRIKAAFSNGYEKGVADGRLEMKAAILSAIEKI